MEKVINQVLVMHCEDRGWVTYCGVCNKRLASVRQEHMPVVCNHCGAELEEVEIV